MKVSQAIEQLYKRLPFLTDYFSESVSIDEITFVNNVATVKTNTIHGLEASDTFTITNIYAPLNVSSIIRIKDKLLVITELDNDLTLGYQKTVTLSGSEQEDFNGTFELLQVNSSTEFVLQTVDAGDTILSGSSVLQQETGSSYNQVVGYNTVASVLNANEFTFDLQSSLNGKISNSGDVSVGFRITGAVSFESAYNLYTSNNDDKYWAFVVSGANVASKDRKQNSDAVYSFNANTGFRQEINQTFSVYVFATATNEIDAYPIKDNMQDVAVALIKSLVGAKFDSGFGAKDYYANVFDNHLTQFYNKGIYAHNFIFQTTTQIVNSDIYEASSDVAFNSINLEMNVILADMEIKPDTEKLTVTVDLR